MWEKIIYGLAAIGALVLALDLAIIVVLIGLNFEHRWKARKKEEKDG